MGFNCGIVGLPNVGKSTIFNAMTNVGVPAEAFPFCTIDPNIGRIPVPDDRLTKLAELLQPEKVTPTTIEFVDIAGLVKGASKGEGLGNQFLGNIRNVHAIAHVVRCFEDTDVAHVSECISPSNDIDTVNLELILADFETLQRQKDKLSRMAKVGEKSAVTDLNIIAESLERLDKGVPLRKHPSDQLHRIQALNLGLLTSKPLFYVLNVDENDVYAESTLAQEAIKTITSENAGYVVLSGKIEAELRMLETEEQADYRDALGIHENGLEKLIASGYRILNLITFYTTVGTELRAWTIKQGSTAPIAAGKIHSDMQKGFIKAEVCHFDDFVAVGSESSLRESGKIRVEGKEYLIRDGDVIKFKFNV